MECLRRFDTAKKVTTHRSEHRRAEKAQKVYDAYKTYKLLDLSEDGIALCPINTCKKRKYQSRTELIDHLLKNHTEIQLEPVDIVKSFLNVTR